MLTGYLAALSSIITQLWPFVASLPGHWLETADQTRFIIAIKNYGEISSLANERERLAWVPLPLWSHVNALIGNDDSWESVPLDFTSAPYGMDSQAPNVPFSRECIGCLCGWYSPITKLPVFFASKCSSFPAIFKMASSTCSLLCNHKIYSIVHY